MMKPSERARALSFARDLSLETGKLLLAYSRQLHARPLRLIDKGAAGLASEADMRAEELVMRRIRRAFPGHQIVSEEDSHARRLKLEGPAPYDPPTWLVDPLDGTTNFLNGLPFWCVSLALLEGPQVQIGVVHAPQLRESFWAQRGKGAHHARQVGSKTLTKKLRAPTSSSSLKDCLISTNLGSKRHNAELIRRFPQVRAFRRLGSAALEICYVGAGILDAYWESGLQPWDVAGGGLVCQEAGVGITDLQGREFDAFSSSLLAARAPLHEDLRAILGPQ